MAITFIPRSGKYGSLFSSHCCSIHWLMSSVRRTRIIETLDDFAGAIEGRDGFHAMRVAALVLAGQSERAAKMVDEIETLYPDDGYWQPWVKTQRRFMERDIASICAEFHTKEAETAKELKLGNLGADTVFLPKCPKRNGQGAPSAVSPPRLGSAAHRDCWAIRPRKCWRGPLRGIQAVAQGRCNLAGSAYARSSGRETSKLPGKASACNALGGGNSFHPSSRHQLKPPQSGATHQPRLCSNQGVLFGGAWIARRCLFRSIHGRFRCARCA